MFRLAALATLALVLVSTAASAQTHTGALEAGDLTLGSGEFVDSYTVEAVPGQTIAADLTSAEFDTYLIVRAPSGSQEDNDDYEGTTGHSHLDVTATERGTYTVAVTSYQGGETGRYRLDLQVSGGRSRASASSGRSSAPARGAAAEASLVGTWVGAEVSATQYRDSSTGEGAPTNGIGTTLELRADGTFRQSQVLNQSTYGCTTTLNVDERGTYSARSGSLVLNRQSGRSWGRVCGGQQSERVLGPETNAFVYELADGGRTLARHTDEGPYDTLSRD
ncbi:MAG TPA: PPC domain-containing protein [Rubricoccaceae bacterium]|jgi:hypothetical protein